MTHPQAVAKLEPLYILHSRSASREPRVVESLDLSEAGQRWLYFYLVRADDLAAVVMQHVPAQGYWIVDELRSPIVECEVTYVDDTVMRGGRLHYVDGYYGSTATCTSEPAVDRVSRAARESSGNATG